MSDGKSVDEKKAEAVELHRRDPDLSYREIGRRVGLNHVTVRRTLEGDYSSGYSYQSPDYMKAFARALTNAYEKEKAFLSDKSSERSTRKRAQQLAEIFSKVPSGEAILTAGRDMCAEAAKLLTVAKKG